MSRVSVVIEIVDGDGLVVGIIAAARGGADRFGAVEFKR